MSNILYVGGFLLPDKNAAALRVVANAKALRELGHTVVFLNAPTQPDAGSRTYQYEGFTVIEYRREGQFSYLTQCGRIKQAIRDTGADTVIAYNHPAVALERLRRFCKRNSIRCYADATEWYVPTGNLLFRLIKGFDTEYRMRVVQPRLDGVIAISDYLYRYYRDRVKTVKIPPLVDLREEKWDQERDDPGSAVNFSYAGSPSAQKERLDLIVNAIESAQTDREIHLDVFGITPDDYRKMYGQEGPFRRVTFRGRVSNRQVIRNIRSSRWAIVLRDRNKVVQAGFPTKVTEVISCGTPVIANRFSNIADYLNEDNSILLNEPEDFSEEIILAAACRKPEVDRTVFDYRNFLDGFKTLLEG